MAGLKPEYFDAHNVNENTESKNAFFIEKLLKAQNVKTVPGYDLRYRYEDKILDLLDPIKYSGIESAALFDPSQPKTKGMYYEFT